MKGGRTFMGTKKKAVLSVLAVALLTIACISFISSGSDGVRDGYHQPITYYSNNNAGKSLTITYDGIASTEYNPEYWEGTGYVPTHETVYMRTVNESGELVKNSYYLYGQDVVIGNKSVYVLTDGGQYVEYDPFVHGNTNNWKGVSTTVQNLSMHITIENGVTGSISLPSGITPKSISNATGGGLTINGNKLSYSGNTEISFDLTVDLSVNKVFGGWNTSADGSGTKYLPGETVPFTVGGLYAQWIIPDVYTKNSATITGTGADDNDIFCEPYYVPGTVTSNSDKKLDVYSQNGHYFINKTGYTVRYGYNADGSQRDADSMYGTIYMLDSAKGDSGKILFTYIPTGTYRSLDPESKVVVYVNSTAASLQGDVIFDDVGVSSIGTNQGKHGAKTDGAILASGHVLIMGTGIVNPDLKGNDISQGTAVGAPQIYGGLSGGTLKDALSSDNMSFNNDGTKTMIYSDGTNVDVKISTCVIIHSGVYQNVVGGSNAGNIGETCSYNFSLSDAGALKINKKEAHYLDGGWVEIKESNFDPDKKIYMGNQSNPIEVTVCSYSDTTRYFTEVDMSDFDFSNFSDSDKRALDLNSSKFRSTYAVLRGGTVGDSIFAGCSGNNVSGTLYGGNPLITYTKADTLKGGSFMYALGNFFMPGDNWQDKQTGAMYTVAYRSTYKIVENSIATASMSKSYLQGCGHLFVSGNASLWVANASNREFDGCTTAGMLDISGSAIIRHVAAGTTANATDALANSNEGYDCTRSVWLNIRDNATVALAFGGGYDIWKNPIGRTMKEGVINVEVFGGRVGMVYGGGYRGSVGTPFQTNLTVNVTVSGGIVEGNVYGGGSGGLDRAQHDENGLKARDVAMMTEGKSNIYGNVNVNITGGTVEGDVYGGGMSVPILSSYEIWYKGVKKQTLNFTTSYPLEFPDKSYTNYVAAIYGAVKVNVSGGTIEGSVYGGGAGLELTNINGNNCSVVGDYSRVRVVKMDGTITTIPWFVGGIATYKTDGVYDAYINYAKVDADINRDSRVDGQATVVTISDDAHIAGSVFGGGCNGYVNGGRYVNIACDDRADGEDYNVDNSIYGGSSVGSDYGDSHVVVSSGWLKSSVFGGGFMGKTNGNTNVYVGYDLNGTVPSKKTEECLVPILIEGSVFAGADVKQGSTFPYSEALVLGEGRVFVYGQHSVITIKGCIMGDGNSCLTKGWKEIKIEAYVSGNKFTGVHRANKVTIANSQISVSGREARVYDKVEITKSDVYYGDNHVQASDQQIRNGTNLTYKTGESYVSLDLNSVFKYITGGYGYSDDYYSGDGVTRVDYYEMSAADAKDLLVDGNKVYVLDTTGSNQLTKTASFFRIGLLELQGGSTIKIENPAEDIRAFSSIGDGGSPTSYSSPMNKIEFSSGGSFYVRTEMTAIITQYGVVKGYTQVSITNQGSYGAYVFGSSASTGGFVVSKEGQYEYTNVTIFQGNAEDPEVKCWFLAGTEFKTLSMTLPKNESTASSSLSIAKIQSDTNMEYSGGYYIPSSAGYEFVRPSATGGTAYSLAFGFANGTNKSLIASTAHYRGNGAAPSAGAYFLGSWMPGGDVKYGFKIVDNKLYAEMDADVPVYYRNGANYVQVDSSNFATAKLGTLYVDDQSTGTYKEAIMVLDDSNNTPDLSSASFNSMTSYYAVSANPSLEDPVMLETWEKVGQDFIKQDGNGVYTLYIQMRGESTLSTEYLGYVLLYVKEFETITYKVNETEMRTEIVVNTMEIRVDLYVEGTTSGNESHAINVDAVYDDETRRYQGSSEVLVQAIHNNKTLKITSITGSRDTPGDIPGLTISGVSNVNGTNGWMESHTGQFVVNSGQNQYDTLIGVLRGTYYATLRVSVDSAVIPDGLQYVITGTIHNPSDGNNTENDVYVTITVTVSKEDFVTLTFHESKYVLADREQETAGKAIGALYSDSGLSVLATKDEILGKTVTLYKSVQGSPVVASDSEKDQVLYIKKNSGTYLPANPSNLADPGTVFYIHTDGLTIKEFRYGTTITESDCPSTASNFTGWYLESSYITLFNYNTRLTQDMDLYARHSYTVTINYGDGTSSKFVLPQVNGDILLLSEPTAPTRDSGFETVGWYTSVTIMSDYSRALFHSASPGIYTPADASQIAAKTDLYEWNGSAFVALDPEIPADLIKIENGRVYYYSGDGGSTCRPATADEIKACSPSNKLYIIEGEWDFEHDYVDGDMTLYLIWTGKSVKITFTDGEHTLCSPITVHYGDSFSGVGGILTLARNAISQGSYPGVLSGLQYWMYDETRIQESAILNANVIGGYQVAITITAVSTTSGDYTVTVSLDATYDAQPQVHDEVVEGYGDVNAKYQASSHVNPASKSDDLLSFVDYSYYNAFVYEYVINGAAKPGYTLSGWYNNAYGNTIKFSAHEKVVIVLVVDFENEKWVVKKQYIVSGGGFTEAGGSMVTNALYIREGGDFSPITTTQLIAGQAIGGIYVYDSSVYRAATWSEINGQVTLYSYDGAAYTEIDRQELDVSKILYTYDANGDVYYAATDSQLSNGKMLFILDGNEYTPATASDILDDQVTKYYFDMRGSTLVEEPDDNLEDYSVEYKVEWDQIRYDVKIGNNTQGYIIASYSPGGSHAGDELNPTYEQKVYLRFEGSGGQVLESWSCVGLCTFGTETIDQVTYTYASIRGDCTITANVRIEESIIEMKMRFEDNTGKLMDSSDAPMIYLVKDGAYIHASNDQVDAGTGIFYSDDGEHFSPATMDQINARDMEKLYVYRGEEYIHMTFVEETNDSYMSYKGLVGNGTYSICLYDGISYFRIEKDITVTDGVLSENEWYVRLIWLLSEPINPSNNLYDVSGDNPKTYDYDEITGTYGDDVEGYIFILGGYSYEFDGTELDLTVIDHATKKIILNAGEFSTDIVLVDDEGNVIYYTDDETKVSRTISFNIAKRTIYIIGKSDWVRQGDSWSTWVTDGYVIYNTQKVNDQDLTMLNHIDYIEWIQSVDTSEEGQYVNHLIVHWHGQSYRNYNVILIDGMITVYRADSSTVTVEIITPVNGNIEQVIQNAHAAPLSVDQISEMAKAESANNVMAVISHSMGRRL